MIKAVFFDYDGVLTTDQTGSLTTARHLSQATGIDFARVSAALARHNRALTLGEASYAQIWPDLCSALGQAVDIGLLVGAFESTPMNARMFALARRLKRRYTVGLITDNKKDRIDHLRRHQDLGSLFCPIVISAELGVDKRSGKIFAHALELAGVRADEAVFIDNHPDNLVAAGALGMKTVFHDGERNDFAALCAALRAHGLVFGDP